MPRTPYLSLAHATLINLNIMIGSGIFINTITLAAIAGTYSAGTYCLVGIAILPLMLCFAQLAQYYPTGSLYTYGAALHPTAGVWSAWSYFHAKLASCAVAIHVASTLLHAIGASNSTLLSRCPILLFDGALLLLFTLLNCYHLRVGTRLQQFFTIGKLLPILTIIIGSALLSYTRPTNAGNISDIILGVPLVLYAFMGFEASSGFTRSLINAERNGWRAIVFSFIGGVTITTLFQYSAIRTLPDLAHFSSFLMVFPAFIARCGITGTFAHLVVTLLHGGIAASAAGVAFGIIYANTGNLHELALKGAIRGSVFLAPVNQYNAAVRCLFIEAIIIALYLAVGTGSLPFLQQIAASGVVVTYTLSVAALWHLKGGLGGRMQLIPALGTISCIFLIAAIIRSALSLGILPYLTYAFIQIIGMVVLTARYKPA